MVEEFVRNLSLVGDMFKQRDSNVFTSTKKNFDQSWPSKLEDYTLEHLLSENDRGKIYSGKCNLETFKDIPIAIKIIDFENTDVNLDVIRKEIQIMGVCDHPNIIQYYTSFIKSTKMHIVMELCEGSVLDLIKIKTKNGLKEPYLLGSILKQVLCGLDYLHYNGLLHRNIKASNILIDKKGIIKLCDFTGAGNLFEQGIKREQRTTYIGTIQWMAPEVLEQSKGYDAKADVWSFGITCIELVKGKVPFADFQPMKVMVAILKHQSPTIEDKEVSTNTLKMMIDSCLLKEPKNRPNSKDLLSYKFIKNFDKGSEYIVTNLLSNLPPLEKRDLNQHYSEDISDNEIEFDFEENKEEIDKLNLDPSEKLVLLIESLKEQESDETCVECERSKAILTCSDCKTNQCFDCAVAIHLDKRFKENLSHELKGL
eukprot:gene9324-1411_t